MTYLSRLSFSPSLIALLASLLLTGLEARAAKRPDMEGEATRPPCRTKQVRAASPPVDRGLSPSTRPYGASCSIRSCRGDQPADAGESGSADTEEHGDPAEGSGTKPEQDDTTIEDSEAESGKDRDQDEAKQERAYRKDPGTTAVVPPPEPPERFPSPYRGSWVSYSNELTAIGLSRAAELMYNPYYAMRIAVASRFWFNDLFYARAHIGLASELTQADWTNDRFYWSDLDLGVGADGLYTIPFVEVSLSAELSMKLPTSKASRASSRMLSNKLSVGFSRGFGIFSLSYSANVEKYWNRFTTGAPVGGLVGSCGSSSTIDCVDSMVQNGLRNASWSFSTGLSGSAKVTEWLSIAADFGLSLAFLYPLTEELLISWQVEDPNDTRYFLFMGLGATIKPTDAVSAIFGARSFHSQLAPWGGYRTPFINRHTQLYLDIRISIQGLVSWLKS